MIDFVYGKLVIQLGYFINIAHFKYLSILYISIALHAVGAVCDVIVQLLAETMAENSLRSDPEQQNSDTCSY